MTLHILINIDVDDLDQGLAFYRDAFGFTLGRTFGGSVIELLGASSAIYLLRKECGMPAVASTEQGRDYDRHWTPVHLDILVPEEACSWVARPMSAIGPQSNHCSLCQFRFTACTRAALTVWSQESAC